ncbi:MAG: hypothetical protein JNM24_15200 [Bdellovibrionaceae bacterium]|nr:hypothetical protein [Pseudobdellovibrionaceae bacterium]
MNSLRYILISILFSVITVWADSASKMASVPAQSSDMANMEGGPSIPSHPVSGISSTNQLLAKAFHMFAFADCIAALVLFFIARSNAKTNYTKAKKFFLIGLVCFVSAILFFMLPKLLFLSPSFPGNFDIRAT